jgi:hypothetical protein
VRTPVLLSAALVLAACGSSDRRDSSAERGASSQSNRGPDHIVLRIPRDGGRVAAYVYPKLDSAVWRSSESAPAIARVLAFDVESGQMAAVDVRGVPTRIDLRLGQVRAASKTPLDHLVSSDGLAIFGVTGGQVTRLTPSGGAWSVRLPTEPEELYPQRDGTLLVAATRGGEGHVWQLRPPTQRVADSVSIAATGRAVRSAGSDRVYFTAGDGLVGVRSRDLTPLTPLEFDGPVVAAATTPSGDRLFVAVKGSTTLSVVDRYADRIAGTVELPGEPRDLRVDPLGRYVLVRPVRGDSAWVVGVATGRLIGGVRSVWRADLPLVLPDGAIATAADGDVTLVDGATLEARSTVRGGAADFWHVVLWNGFRPRAKGLDKPVEFQTDTPATDTTVVDSAAADTTAPPDSARKTPPDTLVPLADPVAAGPSLAGPRVVAESAGEVAAELSRAGGAAVQTRRRRFTVQFAASATERDARRVAAKIRLRGSPLRIVPATRAGKSVWLVVAGPFPTRAAADRAGRAADHEYWVYAGAP